MTGSEAYQKGMVYKRWAPPTRCTCSAARQVDVWPVPVLGQALQGCEVGGARPVLPVVQVPAVALARRLLWPVCRTHTDLLRPIQPESACGSNFMLSTLLWRPQHPRLYRALTAAILYRTFMECCWYGCDRVRENLSPSSKLLSTSSCDTLSASHTAYAACQPCCELAAALGADHACAGVGARVHRALPRDRQRVPLQHLRPLCVTLYR